MASMALNDLGPMLTASEVAPTLHLHVNTVKRLGDRGELPFYRVCKRGDLLRRRDGARDRGSPRDLRAGPPGLAGAGDARCGPAGSDQRLRARKAMTSSRRNRRSPRLHTR